MVNPYRNQLDQQILCAEPLELVVILYRELERSIQGARRYLAEGDIAGRARLVSRAMVIVGELAGVLDMNRGGEVAAGLQRLYAYMAARLLDGNYRQVDGPLAEAEAVATTLLEAWTAVGAAQETPAQAPEYEYALGKTA